MHPEIKSDKPGRCPKCGMKLMQESKIAEGNSHMDHATSTPRNSLKEYMPLVVIITLIFLTTLTLTYRDYLFGTVSFISSLSYFMIGFFLTFSAFKLMDLKGFAEGYSTYDLLARKWFPYGYIYPFIELFFGLGMIVFMESQFLLWAELFIMTFSGIGVLQKLAKREKFQCACLGTFLKVPLTKVTLIEDFGMAFLAAIMLILVR